MYRFVQCFLDIWQKFHQYSIVQAGMLFAKGFKVTNPGIMKCKNIASFFPLKCVTYSNTADI